MIRIGVLGCANIALKAIIPAIIENSDRFQLSGIASRDYEKAKTCSQKYNVKIFDDYQNLIDSNEIDAIYIPLPNSLHFEWVEKSLQKGLHVIVEKSLACSLEDVKYLNELAKNKNLVLFENFQFRFHSQLKYIKSILSEGKIGELRCLRASFGFPPFDDKDNIRYKKELGGGALFDAGAYPIKISQIFLGYDLNVKAANLKYDETLGVDIWGGAYITQKNTNLFSEIAFGFDNFYQCSVELWGSKGKIFTNRIFTAGPNVNPEIILETKDGVEKITLLKDNHFLNMLEHFYMLVTQANDVEEEYFQNINQARLLHELKKIANEQ